MREGVTPVCPACRSRACRETALRLRRRSRRLQACVCGGRTRLRRLPARRHARRLRDGRNSDLVEVGGPTMTHHPATPGRAAAGSALAAVCGLAAILTAQSPAPSRLPLSTLKLPPGFSISVYADNVPNARSMALRPGRHALCRHPDRRKRLRRRRRQQGPEGRQGAHPRHRPGHAERRGGAGRLAVCRRGVPHPAVRQHRGRASTSRRPRSSSPTRYPTRPAPRLEVHRVRARRLALRARRRPVQRLRARRRALRRPSPGSGRTARASRSSRAASATRWASTGTR